MKKEIGFERKENEKHSLEDFVDKWVLLTTDSGAYSGKIIEINEEDVMLLPYLKVRCNEGLERYEIKSEDLPFMYRKQGIKGIKRTSEEEIKDYCDIMNLKMYLQYLREENEIFELEQKRIVRNIERLNHKIIL